ncbi:exosortase family protein XrtG [Lachnospiraceae bacterium MD1]|jgi:exosortase family protein XrtG|uniref:Exosortase family protein XrtG n=1 Tax=Variimorphobacter saccharofermentans TaxID=2755051 RepID=A0A839K182_9FIRM|nr:exosortase family protein XrtG [Variimorphobacter saccharofermentans]MBB2182481.1 exosortase family protein XrtG [Variimorphobacter saccharofermentans]
MNVFFVICLIIWIYLLTVFYRSKLYYFQFLWGSVGLFIFLMAFIQPIATKPLMELVSSASGILGRITGFFEAYHEYGVLFISNHDSSISLYIDYECSGIIEMMAFVSMLAFFQVYDIGQRLIISAIGCVGIFFANVIRIFVICTIIYLYGNDAYYIAHTIVGRLVFYSMSVLLYYYVFTKTQIVKQKIGGFQYAEHTESPR